MPAPSTETTLETLEDRRNALVGVEWSQNYPSRPTHGSKPNPGYSVGILQRQESSRGRLTSLSKMQPLMHEIAGADTTSAAGSGILLSVQKENGIDMT